MLMKKNFWNFRYHPCRPVWRREYMEKVMLEAYIIEKIKKDKEVNSWEPTPLHISIDDYYPRQKHNERTRERETERGVIIIDI